VHVEKNGAEKSLVDGFVTFIHVDENTRPSPPHLQINPINEEDKILYEAAKNLRVK
jgi:hypothetical protein